MVFVQFQMPDATAANLNAQRGDTNANLTSNFENYKLVTSTGVEGVLNASIKGQFL